ncbi:entericidin B membrane lipoprotein [Roseovarius sp. A-2]|nr:entericidin A/B family lipoprotein [Roseovarius sp. A-2]GAW35153.1 entericidin B membrane lipoprotein [Roseovarius sp. A-2]
MIRARISLLSLIAFAFVSACETIEGAGQDIQSTGDAISDTARDADD